MIIELKKIRTCVDFENLIARSRGFIQSTSIDELGNIFFTVDDDMFNALTPTQKQAIRDKIEKMFHNMILTVVS